MGYELGRPRRVQWIVGKHVNDGKFHQGTQAQRFPHESTKVKIPSRRAGLLPGSFRYHGAHAVRGCRSGIAARIILREKSPDRRM